MSVQIWNETDLTAFIVDKHTYTRRRVFAHYYGQATPAVKAMIEGAKSKDVTIVLEANTGE